MSTPVNNDFEDIEKSRVIVDVVGGLCERILGNSVVHMKIVGCDWNKFDPTSSGSYSTYTRLKQESSITVFQLIC